MLQNYLNIRSDQSPCLLLGVKKWQEGNNTAHQGFPIMRSGTYFILTTAALLATACTQFPAIEDRVSEDVRDAPYMDLVPVETLRASVPEDQVTDTDATTVEARIARLRARAARLSGAVVDNRTRTRMSQGVD
jgi:hypothetical protein